MVSRGVSQAGTTWVLAEGLMPSAPWLKSPPSEGSLYSVESIGAHGTVEFQAPVLGILFQLPFASVCPPVSRVSTSFGGYLRAGV